MQPQKQRTAMSLHAYYSLARYYQRVGKQDLYEYFMAQVLSPSLLVITPRNRIQALLQLARKALFKPFARHTFSYQTMTAPGSKSGAI
jgi:hypothetical protein